MKTKNSDVAFNDSLTEIVVIEKAITKAGYDTGKYKADDKAYNSLPECCHFRKYGFK